MANKETAAELATLVKEAELALQKAQEFADKHGLVFHFSPAYGMGGTYFGVSSEERVEMESGGRSSDLDDGWLSSSNNC